MKKLLTALAAATCFSVANAALITIDNFSTNQGPIVDTTVSGLATTAPDAVCDTNSARTLCANLLADPFQSGMNARVIGGQLNVSNGAGTDSQVAVRWNLAAGFIPANAIGSFDFLVIRSDGEPTNLAFFFNGVAINNSVIAPSTVNQTVSFNAPIAQLAAGGVLELRITGSSDWDVQLDSLGLNVTNLQVPVPAIPLLLGAGLVALGLRRKQK